MRMSFINNILQNSPKKEEMKIFANGMVEPKIMETEYAVVSSLKMMS